MPAPYESEGAIVCIWGRRAGRGHPEDDPIEAFWAQLKRGINGTHIHVSAKHLPKYLGGFEYHWNMRQVPHLMLDRLMHFFVR